MKNSKKPSRKKGVLIAATLLAAGALYAPSAFAVPPWEPGNGTIFAPIERDGPAVGLKLVAKGLTAPLKGVAAPGLPNHLFVIDQVGRIYAVNLTVAADRKAGEEVDCSTLLDDDDSNDDSGCTLFFDVGDHSNINFVTLGCVPQQTRDFGGSFDERGLLGLAFHRDFASNGRFYTYISQENGGPATLPSTVGSPDHQNVISEWQAVNASDPSAGVVSTSRRELIRVDWPQFNHDGGDLAIRQSDGTLFISMGDGGGADDRDGQDFIDCGSDPSTNSAMVGHGDDGNGQKLNNPLGKILRIDVDGNNSANQQYGIPGDNPFVGAGGDVVKEIFAFGLRNPYRMSFDKKDPDHFYVGNVGQNDIEEIELVESGANHGWPIKEGTLFFAHNGNEDGFATPDDPGTAVAPQPLAPKLVEPVSQYDTIHEGHAVVMGFLYRGKKVKKLRGRVVFGDFSHQFRFPIGPQDYGRLFMQRRASNPDCCKRIEELRIVPGNQFNLALLGWGEDSAGELYPMGNTSGLPFFEEGLVLKIVPAPKAQDID
ncbi:quinoprotein glucose dehydrogenase B [bacterium MnTg02]|nr:quinoprotein glucose dehydrogenase B [bacterium MnTg02]